MLFLKSWLSEYIDLSAFNNQELSNLITNKSSEVDELIPVNDLFDGKVVIGQIRNLRNHPDADNLQVFDVNFNDSISQTTIVSAAPNVREGLIIPVATIGTILPYLKITPRKLRGVESLGMCCGKSELLLEEGYSDGLWELDCDESNLGKSIVTVYPELFKTDLVLDIKVLPNRIARIGSHLGMALEIATIAENYNLLTPLARKLLDPKYIEAEFNAIGTDSDYQLELEDKLNYAREFELFSLKLQADYIMPCKFVNRMFLLKKNLTGTIADLSNYLMADVGQPSHIFDLAKI
jgi:phenylalanyl-tRNA synthetase beta chain